MARLVSPVGGKPRRVETRKKGVGRNGRGGVSVPRPTRPALRASLSPVADRSPGGRGEKLMGVPTVARRSNLPGFGPGPHECTVRRRMRIFRRTAGAANGRAVRTEIFQKGENGT